MTREMVQARSPRVLVAGFGNVLRRDDGFGVVVARRLRDQDRLSDGVVVLEVGIGGMSCVQELLDGYDALIVLDAVQRDGPPGRLYILEVETPDIGDFDEGTRQDLLADMHYAEPGRALILARALGALPPRVWIVGCQPLDADDLGIGLSPPVALAAEQAVAAVERLIITVLAMRTAGTANQGER